MKMLFITFRSVTPAQRAQRSLQQAGIYCSLQRTPSHMQEKGCGYCLRVPESDIRFAVQRLKNNRIGYSKVYTLENGLPEEMTL